MYYKREGKQTFFCKQTRPAISKSPILQAKNNRWQYLCNIVYTKVNSDDVTKFNFQNQRLF